VSFVEKLARNTLSKAQVVFLPKVLHAPDGILALTTLPMWERFDRRVDKVVHRSNQAGLNRFLDGSFLLGLEDDRHTRSLPIIVAVSGVWSHRFDLRALSPLKWQHVNPYGSFTLKICRALRVGTGAVWC
jgi:hypothetical protein